jgi:hypothetical protein
MHVDSTRSCHTLSLKLYRSVKNVTHLRSVTSYIHIVPHQPYIVGHMYAVSTTVRYDNKQGLVG